MERKSMRKQFQPCYDSQYCERVWNDSKVLVSEYADHNYHGEDVHEPDRQLQEVRLFGTDNLRH